MSTSAAAITQAIKDELMNYQDVLFDLNHDPLMIFVECIAKGVYAELQNLSDVPAGTCSFGDCSAKAHE